jgi:multiple sugar transport system permease protein
MMRLHKRSSSIDARPSIAFVLPAILFVSVFSLFPLYSLVRMSVSAVSYDNVLGDWPYVGLRNFRALLDYPLFREALTNTVLFVGVVVSVSIVGGMLAALLFRRRTRGGDAVQALLLFAWMLPPIVSGSVWKFMFSTGGAVDAAFGLATATRIGWLVDPSVALYSVAFVNAWAALPFAAIVLKAGLLGLPADTQEAAAIDGASAWRIFWTVTLPQMRPVILVLGVLITVYAFRSFDFIFVMTLGGPGTSSATLPYLGYRDAFTVGYFDRGAAIATVSGLFIAVAAIAYVRLSRRAEVLT